MPLHPQAQRFLALLAASGLPPLHESSPEEARALSRLGPLITPGPALRSVRDVAVAGGDGPIPGRVYEAVADPPGTVVYYHGGGWVLGGLDDSDAVCRTLAAASGCRIVSVDYRLAPEHPFPAAAEDAYAALRWVAAELAGDRPVAVAGDSAGGNLAAVACLQARAEGGPPIALQVLVYPVCDHDFETASYRECEDAGLLLGRREMIWFWSHYAPAAAQRADPRASPLRAPDHAGLPPAHVVIAGHDPLRDEGLAYARKLEAAGVAVTVRHYPDQVHAFFSLLGFMDDAGEAVAEVAAAIRRAVEAA